MGGAIRNFVRKYILKNLPYKLISLAIAVMLWWAVGRDQPIEIPITVPSGISARAGQSGNQL